MSENYTVDYQYKYHAKVITKDRKKIERAGLAGGFDNFLELPDEREIYARIVAETVTHLIDTLPNKMLPAHAKRVTVTISDVEFS